MKKNRFLFFKKRSIILVAIAVAACAALIPAGVMMATAPVQENTVGKTVIVIDPGHGGVDGGANREGVLEKDINLSIAKKLCEKLKVNNFHVIMTREEDVSLDGQNTSSKSRHKRDLNARMDIINGSGAVLFICVHVNCIGDSRASGSFVFYNEKQENSKALAACIQKALNEVKASGAERKAHEPVAADYYLLRGAKIPGVLVETAFISNETERKLLADEDFKQSLADAIAQGAGDYLKNGGNTGSPNT
jgi:N-acetylmuramoyl-L-alanine amidase